MRTMAVCAVGLLVACESAEEKAERRWEAAHAGAAQRRANTARVTTTATNLVPVRAELVVRVSPAGIELEDLELRRGLDHAGPRTLDRFKRPGTADWQDCPLLRKALDERDDLKPGHAALTLDVAPATPAFRVEQVLSTIEFASRLWRPSVTFAGPAALGGVWVETSMRNEYSETCGHGDPVPTTEACVVPRVRLGPAGAQVLARAGTPECFLADADDPSRNEGPFLAVDGGCSLEAPAALVQEVAALRPGCRHTIVELASMELSWARMGSLIATLAAEDPERTFVLTSARFDAPPLSCAGAARPAQWKHFSTPRPPPRPPSDALRALFGDGGLLGK